MDSEKELLIYNIKGKFVKNFDTFSAMDPFLQVTIGKSSNRTETIKKGGKEVTWQTAVTLYYVNQTDLKFQAFDQDLTENQSIGSAILKVSELKAGTNKGEAKVFIGKEETGLITFEYTLKDMRSNPTLIFSNIKCSFVKKTELFIKCSPFFCATAGHKTDKTQVIKGSEKQLAWAEKVRLTYDTPERFIKVQVLDADSKDKPLFTHTCRIEEFDQLKSHKSINITDLNFEYLGTLEFDYQSSNLVSDKESANNAKTNAQNENFLTSIILTSIKAQFLKDGFDPYLKIVLGSNVTRTSVVKKAKKDVSFQDTIKLYAESKETKISFIAYDKKLIKDEIIGVGQVFLSDVKPSTTVKLQNRQGDSKGTITFSTNVSKSIGKTIKITQIKADFKVSADTFGKMDPFVEVSIGGFVDRTETIDQGGQNVIFKRLIILKFIDQQKIIFKSFDEDVTENELLGEGQMKVSDLTIQKGQKMVNLVNSKKEYIGVLLVSYESTNVVKPSEQQKGSSQDAVNNSAPIQAEKDTSSKIASKDPEAPKDQPKDQQKSSIKDSDKKQQNNDSPSKKNSVIDNKKSDLKSSQTKKQEDSPKKQEMNNSSVINKNSQVQQKKSQKEILEVKKQDKQGDIQKNASIKPGLKAQEELHQSSSNRQGSLPNVSRRLPPVVEKKNYGDRIFQQQSAMTLQKSILSYSMPKAARFAETVKPIGAQPTYYVESCFRTDKSKGAGFGYGTRRPYPDWMERNMKENPAPGAYEAFPEGEPRKGKTFGISYKHYEKVMIPKEEKLSRRPNQRLSPLKMKEQQQH